MARRCAWPGRGTLQSSASCERAAPSPGGREPIPVPTVGTGLGEHLQACGPQLETLALPGCTGERGQARRHPHAALPTSPPGGNRGMAWSRWTPSRARLAQSVCTSRGAGGLQAHTSAARCPSPGPHTKALHSQPESRPH